MEETKKAPTVIQGLVILAIVVIVLATFLTAVTKIGVSQTWVPLLFIFFWASIEHADVKKMPATAVGSAVGLGAAYMLHALPAVMGINGFLIGLGVVLVMVYLIIMQWAAFAINSATMLFLTVGTIPNIHVGSSYQDWVAALVCGVVFFGGLAWGVGKAVAHRATKAAAVKAEA